MKTKIDRLGMNGEGIFNIQEGEDKGKVAFVDFALPNEYVECEVIKNNSKFCKCKLNKITTKSKERVEPRCKYFYKCGGCDLQHMNNDLQQSFKKKKILDVVSKIDSNIKDIEVVGKNDFNYRNKMVFPFYYDSDGIKLGMFEKNSHRIIDIDRCLLASENINKLLQISKEYFYKTSDKYQRIISKVKLEYLVVREIDNNFLVAIVVDKKYNFKDFYEFLNMSFDSIGLSVVVNNSDKEILSGEYYHLYGNQNIQLTELGITYNIDIMSFMQVNNSIKIDLYNRVLNNIGCDDVVVDAYSGAGLMSAIVAKKCKKVIGLEINKFAHNKADELAKSNGINNLINLCGDANILLKNVCNKYNPQTVILDPARNGCGVEITDFLSNNVDKLPDNIIYVSCNLATLKRDLLRINNNYCIKSVCGLEMFPQTKHIETLVILKRR